MYEHFLWYALVPSGCVYVALIIMSFVGMDSDIDVEVDTDFDDLTSVLTLRNAIYFTFGYSGGTLAGIENGFPVWTSTIIGLVVGFFLVGTTIGLMFLGHKLKQENIPSYDGLVGKTARVYLTIQGVSGGKITVQHNGTQREYSARSNEHIQTGATVIIESVENGVAHVKKQ